MKVPTLDELEYEDVADNGWEMAVTGPRSMIPVSVYRSKDHLRYAIFRSQAHQWVYLDPIDAQAILYELFKDETPANA